MSGSALVPLQRLVDGLRHPRSRADELAEVRRRFVDAGRDDPGPAERTLAVELRRLTAELQAALGEVVSCGGCARGHPLPAGRYPGGHCCTASTSRVFAEDEVAVLHVAGVRGHQLRGARGEHVGCAFRGEEGCRLLPEQRPTLCVRYLCGDLRQELKRSRKLDALRLARELEATFARYVASRARRLPPPNPWE